MHNTLAREMGDDMPQAKVFLSSLVHDSPEFGSDDERTVSRAFLELQVDGTPHEIEAIQAKVAKEMRAVGFDVDFAPVADVPGSSASFMYRDGRTFSFSATGTSVLANASTSCGAVSASPTRRCPGRR